MCGETLDDVEGGADKGKDNDSAVGTASCEHGRGELELTNEGCVSLKKS